MKKVQFERKSPFYEEVRAEVEAHFRATGKSFRGDARLHLKTFLLLTSMVGVYTSLLLLPPGWGSVALSAVLGFVLALIGFNVMHDACHGSYSERVSVNELFGYSMNLLGSNQFIWKLKHNVVHHTYTNVDGVDDDIMKAPVLRHCPSQPRYAIHRYQHIYGFLLYAVSTILWVFVTDTQKYLGQHVSGTHFRQFPFREHVIYWLTKVLYVAVYLVIPIAVLGFWPWLVGYLIMNAVFGLTLSVVFQLAHAVEITEFHAHEGETLHMDKEWAVHQVITTADFAMGSRLANWLLGGLNFQVIHHLFPYISHVHYREIQPIVARVCERHGIRYRSYRTMWQAVRSHVRYLKMLGEKD